jgi:hypothetical protein
MPDEEPADQQNHSHLHESNSSSNALNDSLTLVSQASKLVSMKKYMCNEHWESPQRQQTYTLFNFFAVYLIPVFILGKFGGSSVR